MSQQKKGSTKLEMYKQVVGKQVELTLNNLVKAKQDQTESLGELFNSLRKSVLRQIQRTYKKFLSAIQEKISCLQSSLIEANQETAVDNLDIFTLENVHRFTKRIQSESDKYLINKFRLSIEKLEKSMLDSMKDIQLPQAAKIPFIDTMRIQKVKNLELDSKPLGLDTVNDKLIIWGNDFYNYDGRDKQVKTSEILHMKSIKLYEKGYLLIIHKDYLDIEQPKAGVLVDRINGDFQNILSVVSSDDLVYFVKSNCIVKMSLSTGKLTTKHIGPRVVSGASKTLYMNCLAVSFRGGEAGLFNNNLQLVWVWKYPVEVETVIGGEDYLIVCGKTDLYVNCLSTTIFKKQINIDQICLLNNQSLLVLNNQAMILSLITFEMKDVKLKWNKKVSSSVISDGTTVSMILNNNNQVVVYRIE